MFISKADIKQRIEDVILCGTENDLIFLVACRGIGKLQIFTEILESNRLDPQIILADGKIIKRSTVSPLEKCYIEGICKYLKSNNRRITRTIFIEAIKATYGFGVYMKLKFLVGGKFDIDEILKMLSGLDLYALSDIYIKLAGDTPLVLLMNHIDMRQQDIDYVKSIGNDNRGARITHIIAIRPDSDNVKYMKSIIETRGNSVSVFPVLSDIQESANPSNPLSIAAIAISGIGDSVCHKGFCRRLMNRNEYCKTYQFVQKLLNSGLKPDHLYFLAKQEMDVSDYEHLRFVAKKIYGTVICDDNDIVLPCSGKMLWLDVLSYYLTIHDGISDAIAETQKFCFDILLNARRISYDKNARRRFGRIVKVMASAKENNIANGFSVYYSNFAELVGFFFNRRSRHAGDKHAKFFYAHLLDKLAVGFTDTNIKAIRYIYDKTQIAAVLDSGAHAIERFLGEANEPLPQKTVKIISVFLERCMLEACRWHDITLIDNIVRIQKNAKSCTGPIRFKFPDAAFLLGKDAVCDYLLQQLGNLGMTIGDVIMNPKTIFLSYAHSEKPIAERLYTLLKNCGYNVKRDVNNVRPWGGIKDFMNSIRIQDYVVVLVSNSYLHSENCMYEVSQLLKDDSFKERTLSIVITPPAMSDVKMFSADYRLQMILHWQNHAKQFKKKIKALEPENAKELLGKFRDIRGIAENISVFMDEIFVNKLSATLDLENFDIDTLAEQIVNEIRSRV